MKQYSGMDLQLTNVATRLSNEEGKVLYRKKRSCDLPQNRQGYESLRASVPTNIRLLSVFLRQTSIPIMLVVRSFLCHDAGVHYWDVSWIVKILKIIFGTATIAVF